MLSSNEIFFFLLENKTAESSSSGPPAAKPVATVLPVPSLSALTTTASQANRAAPAGQGHQVSVLHPVPGEGGTGVSRVSHSEVHGAWTRRNTTAGLWLPWDGPDDSHHAPSAPWAQSEGDAS